MFASLRSTTGRASEDLAVSIKQEQVLRIDCELAVDVPSWIVPGARQPAVNPERYERNSVFEAVRTDRPGRSRCVLSLVNALSGNKMSCRIVNPRKQILVPAK